jgi:hypothetical protein
MARIIVNATMIQLPFGGLNYWILTWLVGLKHFGHEVYVVEQSGFKDSCFDLKKGVMTDDCSYGVSVIKPLLARYGLEANWCFIDYSGSYHGMSQATLNNLFKTADAFFDFEWGSFYDLADEIPVKVFVDGEPGWFQMRLANMVQSGEALRHYDCYYTIGLSIGTDLCSVPTLGIDWQHGLMPTMLQEMQTTPAQPDGGFTSIMQWQSHKSVDYEGETYGQKDIEFEKFMELPRHVQEKMEVAVSGKNVPRERLERNGWHVRMANSITYSVDNYLKYIAGSKGEFSVIKNAFVKSNCGWFGDRSGIFLGHGKPVVLQDSGFSKHLPCGRGLIAVSTLEEGVEAINQITMDYPQHSKAARQWAEEFLSFQRTVGPLLDRIGLS